ncbi:hypothetical protein [Candidatus Hodarchaeum mangrovi]
MEGSDTNQYRIILKSDDSDSNLRNKKGLLTFHSKKIKFTPQNSEIGHSKSYSFGNLKSAILISQRVLLRKKDLVKLQFTQKESILNVLIEPLDVSARFLIETIITTKENSQKSSLQGVFGSFIEKMGAESQKFVREVGAIIESSSKDLSQAIDQSIQFIRDAINTANLLESIDLEKSKKEKTLNLEIKDIDEILRRSLASDKIDAMIAGLIAKGLISAQDQKISEALDALKIAREAAKNENMEEYSRVADENIKQLEEKRAFDPQDPELSKKAKMYAEEAKQIVDEWEKSKQEAFDDETA